MSYDLKADPEINEKYILSRISQEEIFEYYLGVGVQTKEHIRSPLRDDKHPTCNFNYHKGRLYFMDWALFDHPKDCFGIVQFMYNLSYPETLQKIAADLNVVNKDRNDKLQFEYKASQSSPDDESTPTLIEVKKQDFTPVDKKYLSQYNITNSICDFYRVFSLEQIWLNREPTYRYSKDDPAIGYYFGMKNGCQQWKIYFYQRDRFRFMCNTNRIQGYAQLSDEGNYCVITKSLKDVMSMYAFDIPAIAPQSESVIPPSELINELQDRFTYVVSLYDYDYTGVSTANEMRKKYNIPALFLTGEEKDFSDFVANHTDTKITNLINEAKNYVR